MSKSETFYKILCWALNLLTLLMDWLWFCRCPKWLRKRMCCLVKDAWKTIYDVPYFSNPCTEGLQTKLNRTSWLDQVHTRNWNNIQLAKLYTTTSNLIQKHWHFLLNNYCIDWAYECRIHRQSMEVHRFHWGAGWLKVNTPFAVHYQKIYYH